MRKLISIGIASCLFVAACNDDTDSEVVTAGTTEENKMTEADMIKRGDYIVATGGCNDCHTPKIMTPQGPKLDSSRLLSGHPENSPLPPIDKKALQPGNWMLFAPDLTSAVGPWGMTHSANLTSDVETGIGNWTEASFIKALRTGKHKGLDEGRPIMPPMPWQEIGKLTDDDLKAVFAFLKSTPPIKNRVPDPVPPPMVEKMK
jgi:mono/diheme cytochrome c family protein